MKKSWPEEPPRLVGVLENIRSLHNVGALFRTADGAGFGGLALCGITGCPPRNEIRKTALGAEEFVAWRYENSALEAISSLKAAGYFVLALEKTDKSVLLEEVACETPLALVVGNEYYGVSEEALAAADAVGHIPMFGQKISLNVSVAFGVAAYEIRKRLGDR